MLTTLFPSPCAPSILNYFSPPRPRPVIFAAGNWTSPITQENQGVRSNKKGCGSVFAVAARAVGTA
jgi:hypothetical protein